MKIELLFYQLKLKNKLSFLVIKPEKLKLGKIDLNKLNKTIKIKIYLKIKLFLHQINIIFLKNKKIFKLKLKEMKLKE